MFAFVPYTQSQMLSKDDTLEYKYPYEINISAGRFNIPLKLSPFSASLIGTDVLKYMPKSICVDEPLKLVPGVKIDNQADGERVHLSVRGQGILSEHGIRGIKIMLDGLPLNDPTGFTPDFYDVDWATVEKIEVLRGPAASLYGGSSSAGVINIITQNGGDKQINGEAYGTYGTYNFWKGLAQIGSTYKSMNFRLSVSRMMGDGYRVHTHYRGNNIYGKFNFTVNKKIKLTPVLFYTDFFNENPEGLNLSQYLTDPEQPNADAVPKNEFMHTKRFTGGISGFVPLSSAHDIQFYALGRSTKYTESVPSSVIHRDMFMPGGSLQYTFHYGQKKGIKNHLSIGADFLYQTLDEYRKANLGSAIEGDTKLSDETFKQTGIGVFALDRIEFTPKLSAFLSVRYDDIKNKLEDHLKNPYDVSGDENFSRTTGKVGLTFSPKDNINIYANWGTGFMPPATEELALNPDGFGGFNKNLVSATSMGEEIGARVNISRYVYFDLAFFHLKTENDFDRYRMTERPLETFYRNAAASQRFGAEFFTKLTPIKYVTFQAAYTYSNFKYDLKDSLRIIMDDPENIKYIKDGNYLPNSPQHQLMVDLQINPISAFSIGFSSETYSRSYIDGANIIKESVGEFTLFNARIAYQWKIAKVKGDISFQVRNIFSRKWIAFTEPDPGGNSYQPGTPREIFGAIRIGL